MRFLLPLVLLLLLAGGLNGQFLFEGTAPQAYWGKTVHLDVIDGWNDFRLIAEDQLLAETRVDSSGRFRFEGNGLPAARGFYRLRFRDQKASPPTSMWAGNRHFIHFVAGPNDTLRFIDLALKAPDAANALIDRAARKFDQLNKELLSAESGRLASLIEDKRKHYIGDMLGQDDAAVDVFLLGHWPYVSAAPLRLLENLEARLEPLEGLRPEYLASLREYIGAKSLTSHRRQLFWLKLLLGVVTAGLLLAAYFLWRERRFRVKVKEQGKAELPPVDLSPKEEEVLAGIVAGESNKAIAARLFVSEATVKSHINSIYKKAGIGKRKEAIAFGRARALK
jgi:DNA-binding CsgD family transcriptional regulator